MKSDIMTISRLRMGTDGDGVSTLVTFYGCPLQCRYCANDFCHGRGVCFDDLPRATYTPKELVEILRKDDIYYKMSGGGIVFGGGEPLLQSAFIHKVCQMADHMWKKRIETSLNVAWDLVEPLLGDMDEWIIDIKDIDGDIYQKYTGVDNEQLIANLHRMKEFVDPSKLHIRVPRIPGLNTEADVARSVKWVFRVLGVEPEVFEYYVTTKVNDNAWDDDEEGE